MLVLESFEDLRTSYGILRTHVFTPTMPGEQQKLRFPGIVVFSEIYQVTEPIKRFCRMASGRGYIVAAPEIYHEFEEPGAQFPYDDQGTDRGNALKVEKELKSYDEDSKAVLDYILKHPQCTGAVGTAGICIGGHLALRAAFDPRVRCAALIEPTDVHAGSLAKGKNADTLQRIKDVRGELMVIFGHLDTHIPLAGRTLIREKLNEYGITHTFLELAHVQHAYIRDELSKGRYDPAAARVSFELIFDMFHRKLWVEGQVTGGSKL
ncbi:dienelactone hydrolase [Hyaloraphidium curvatum]|nr:dienelactone hydrolase [Hyaloraphidium curvatum]